MSLNGLDNENITAAHQSALNEAGGWFLLKYASRDEVDLYARGHGGIAEMRGEIAQYPETSPLYGFLLYRRRKVLVKYTPEGTSRLLQARVTVHFHAVTEKFSPFDTILNLNTPEGLNDSALALAFPLHTASPSNSSNRLHEISEDGEDAQIQAKRNESPSMDTVSEPPTLGSTTEPESPKHFDTPAISVSDDKTSMLLQPNTVGSKIVVSEEELNRVNDLERKNEPTIRSPSPPHIAKYEFLTSLDDRPRLSSQSAHPSPSDLYESSLYGFKPKLKLGPRPSLDTKKRPNASGPNGWAGSRPVSTLPAGLKMFPKKTAEPSRNLQNPHRQKSVAEKPKNDGAPVPQPPPPPIPDVPSFTIPSPRPTSRGSTKSMPSSISPEKKRLMKALALRKKQMAAAKTRVPETSTPEVNNSESVVGGKDDPIGRRSSEGHLNSFYARAKADSGAELTSENEPHLEPGKITQNFQDEYNAESSTPLQSELNRSRETDALPHDSHHEDVASGDVLKNGPLTSSGSNSVGEQVLSDTGSQITDRPKTAIQREDDADAFGEESAPVKESEDTEDLVLIPEPSESDLTAVNLRQKRRGIVKPIQIHVTGDNSDADYLSDDSFMEELKSAKVEEAKSLPISKSPATPIFSRRPSSISANSGTPRPGSYVSSEKTEKQKHRTPTPEPPKTSQERSSPISAQHKSQEAANISRQRTVSSDISKRIQALAQHSHHQRLPAGVHPAINTDSSSTFLTLRKHALRNQSQADLASSPKIQKTTSSSGDSRTMSYEQRQTTYQVHHKQGRPESISVTARIVRDPQMQKSEFSAPTENGPLALYQSPLIINHQKSGTPIANFSSPSMGSTPPSSFPLKQNPQRNDPLHASSSEQSNRGSSSNAAPRASESSRRSFARSRHSSDLKSSPSTARSQSNSSLASDDRPQDSSVDANAGKRKSRTSRLFKRMSNSMTSANSHRRRSLAAIMSPTASDTLEEENRPPLEDSVEPLVEEQMLGSGTGWTPVEVGDLNVQFPDTLLWKRRWVEIDAQGFLVLGLSRANGHQRGVTKKYHLSEFKRPSAPDQDRQELPHSVILDSRGGSTLQCACEDHSGQAHVLRVLQDAHKAWNS